MDVSNENSLDSTPVKESCIVGAHIDTDMEVSVLRNKIRGIIKEYKKTLDILYLRSKGDDPLYFNYYEYKIQISGVKDFISTLENLLG